MCQGRLTASFHNEIWGNFAIKFIALSGNICFIHIVGAFLPTQGGNVKATTGKTLLFSQMEPSEKAGIFYSEEEL